jgi:hypothetical protein
MHGNFYVSQFIHKLEITCYDRYVSTGIYWPYYPYFSLAHGLLNTSRNLLYAE